MNTILLRQRHIKALALFGVFAAAITMLLIFSGKVKANILSFYETRYNTDVVAAGVGGLRGSGNGTIALNGVSGTVNKAYLYWNGVTNSTDPFDAGGMVNGVAVTGVNLGISHDNVWGFQNSQAWRADVTAIVAGDGNGNYALTGFSTGSNGASLIVFFDDGIAANDRDVYIFNGNDSSYPGSPNNTINIWDPTGWTLTMNGLHFTPVGLAYLHMQVADGQDFSDGALLINGNTFIPGPHIFDGNSVPPAVFFGNLWDVKAFDLTNQLTAGDNNLTLTSSHVSDGITMVAVLADLPAGSPPDVSGATPSIGCLNPPNHKFRDVSILGVTDPDGDTVTLTILGITSDEPTATQGSGGATHEPDATGVGTNTASLRAERSGQGDGRVYEITFLADDGNGGQTQGSVFVKVPHDNRGSGCTAVDSGQNYDATQ